MARLPLTRSETRAHGARAKRKRAPVVGVIAPLEQPPRAPSSLGPAGKAAWRRWWSCGWLTELDVLMVRGMAELVDDVAELEAIVEADGRMVRGSKGQPVAHPALKMRNELLGDLRRAMDACGFTPLGRRRLGIETREPAPLDAVEDFLAARGLSSPEVSDAGS